MYIDRINKIRKKIEDAGVEGILISNAYNIFYLSGFKTLSPNEREGFLFITSKHIYLFTDGRYVDNKLQQIILQIKGTFKLIKLGEGLMFHLKEIIRTENISTVSFEEDDLKYSEYLSLKKELLTIQLKPLKWIILALREIKDIDEVSKIQKASELTDKCLEHIVKIIKPGMSEKELAWKIEVWIREKGHELAFESIVAVNENSAVPHYDTRNGDGVIKNSSVVLLDVGMRYQNYNSDITRMIFIGKQSDEVINTYQTLLAAQEAAIKTIKVGERLGDVDKLCRDMLIESGLPEYAHSTGHGVGLEVHESPRVSKISGDVVTQGHVFTVEPGVYYLNKFGMRVEDTVIIGDKNDVVVSTKFPKSYLQLF